MKMGTPVTAPPKSVYNSKYKTIWDQVYALNGKWLPIECATPEEAASLYTSANNHRSLLRAARRGNTVYIQEKGK